VLELGFVLELGLFRVGVRVRVMVISCVRVG